MKDESHRTVCSTHGKGPTVKEGFQNDPNPMTAI